MLNQQVATNKTQIPDVLAPVDDVPPGYKRSEVGVIPKDWEARPLGPQVTITSGESPSHFHFGASGTPYFKVEQLNNSNKYLGCNATEYFIVGDTKTVPPSSVLFPKRGASIMLNKVRLLEEYGYMDTNMMALTPASDLNGEYLYYALSHIQLWSIADVTSIPQINNKHIKPLVVPIPQLVEQRAIAEALSDVDTLIAALDKLIAKKRAIKQAAMQQLLTGKTRLPGFSGEWEMKLLGDFASIRNQKVFPSNMDPETPCVELEHIGQDNGQLLDCSTARYSTSSKYRFFSNDVLLGRLRPYLRKFWYADRDGICTTEIWPLTVDPGQAFSGFLFAIVQTDRFIETAGMSYGTHMPRADWGVIQNLEICVPQITEQKAIAAVLSDMDAEIAALERRRDKTRQIKQGMMQELLTGRTRLVPQPDREQRHGPI